MVAQTGRAPELLSTPGRAAVGKKIVHKANAMPDKAIVPDLDQITNEGVRLNTGSFPDFAPRLNFDKRTDEAVVANLTAVNIGWLDNGHVFTE